jgi:hypothetical protein
MKKILATGRLTNRVKTTKLTSVHIHNDTLKWIEENSSGNKQLIINYLLKKGIDHINLKKSVVVIENLED